LGVAGAVPALTEPDDDGPGNGSGNEEQEPVEPWLDDDKFARLVAGLELPSVPEAQEQERERGTGSRSGMGAGNGEPSREQEPLLENEERGTGNGERGPEPFRNEERERGTGNGEPLLSDGEPVPQERERGTGNGEPVPQERERGTGNGLRAVPDSKGQGTGTPGRGAATAERAPRCPRQEGTGNGEGGTAFPPPPPERFGERCGERFRNGERPAAERAGCTRHRGCRRGRRPGRAGRAGRR